MIVKSPMQCKICKEDVEVKMKEDFISLKCRCQCVVHKPDGKITVVPAEKFDKNYKKNDRKK